MHNTEHTFIKDEKLDAGYFYMRHASGLSIYVYPCDLTTSYAMLSPRYGSLDRTFRRDGEDFITVPDGVAHFLEHKMFEEEDGSDAFEKFAALGANANAYTSHEMTSYLFSATENVKESLEVLLSFVSHPHFTNENVQKEMGIIGQEIDMYNDHPASRLYYATLAALYREHNVRINIAGTKETIAEITPETLYTCYRTFYHPSNMILTVAGRLTVDDVLTVVEKVFGKEEQSISPIERVYPKETEALAEKNVSFSMEIATPMFTVAFKDLETFASAREKYRHYLAVNVFLRLLFSRSSSFYNELYASGLVTDSTDAFYESMASCAYAMVVGESERPEEACARIREALRGAETKRFCEADFVRIKRTLYAENVRILDSTESIAAEITDAALQGLTLWETGEVLRELTYEEVCAVSDSFFKEKENVCVTIYPKTVQ